MDFTLDKQHEMCRTLFRDFAQNEVKPLAQEVDETERFPMETVQKLNPKLVGVNNRNLKTFEVNLSATAGLASMRQAGQLLVSESGIKNNADMKTVQKNGADAVLIGETLMRSDNITETLHALREGTA